MKITIDFLRSKGACSGGIAWFQARFGEDGEYQEVLDALAEDDRADDAEWLLDHAGVDAAALKVVDGPIVGRHLFASGRLEIRVGLRLAGSIKSGGGIKAGEGIEAGGGIEAGEGIEAGGGIKSGWGIEAGGGIKAGGGIEAGEGIEAGFWIRCAKRLSVRLRIFAGTCSWRLPTPEEQVISCASVGGTVAHGTVVITKADAA